MSPNRNGLLEATEAVLADAPNDVVSALRSIDQQWADHAPLMYSATCSAVEIVVGLHGELDGPKVEEYAREVMAFRSDRLALSQDVMEAVMVKGVDPAVRFPEIPVNIWAVHAVTFIAFVTQLWSTAGREKLFAVAAERIPRTAA